MNYKEKEDGYYEYRCEVVEEILSYSSSEDGEEIYIEEVDLWTEVSLPETQEKSTSAALPEVEEKSTLTANLRLHRRDQATMKFAPTTQDRYAMASNTKDKACQSNGPVADFSVKNERKKESVEVHLEARPGQDSQVPSTERVRIDEQKWRVHKSLVLSKRMTVNVTCETPEVEETQPWLAVRALDGQFKPHTLDPPDRLK